MAPVNPYAAWFTAAHREWSALLATDPAEQVELELDGSSSGRSR